MPTTVIITKSLDHKMSNLQSSKGQTTQNNFNDMAMLKALSNFRKQANLTIDKIPSTPIVPKNVLTSGTVQKRGRISPYQSRLLKEK